MLHAEAASLRPGPARLPAWLQRGHRPDQDHHDAGVIWASGSQGESLPVSSGIELRGGNLRLEVTYNPGTGWLYDSSGIEH